MHVDDVKQRVCELAEELNISERTLVNWLSRKGYPGARSNDWLTPKLARSARLALQSKESQNRGILPSSSQASNQFSQRLHWLDQGQFNHLYARPSALRQEQESATSTALTDPELPPLASSNEHEYINKTETKASHSQEHELLQRERDRSALLLQRLEGLRQFHEDRYQELRLKYEQTVDERTQLRQKLHAQNQNQATLDQACRELSHELEHNRKEVNELKQRLKAQDQMSTAIDRVNQQKQAWRARALALEEQVQNNQHLDAQLKELGMSTLDQQMRLFKTLLSSPESASQLFNAIKMVEHDQVKKMVTRWVVKTCSHPLCNQVNTIRHKLSFRVDRPHRCEVCKGQQERRWFQRMVAGCEQAQVKRFLLVGGDEIHPRLRELSEGQHVDFRLILSSDESSPQRIRGRLESCDLLITWPRGQLATETGLAYRSLAPAVECPLLDMNGEEANVAQLSRHILNWSSRVGP